MKVATASVNWNNADLGEGNRVPFPDILDLAREAGYTAMEYNPVFGGDVDTLRREAEARGITWCGTYQPVDLVSGPLDDEQLDEIALLAGRLAAIDCHDMVVAEPGRPERIAIAGQVPADGSASLPRHTYVEVAANLHAAGAVAREQGVDVHFHNHVGTWIETPAEVDALLQHLDTGLVDLCFDTGHYAYGGGDALTFLQENVGRIGYLHLKDVDAAVLVAARDKGWSFLEALEHVIFSPLGEGSADIPAILDTLVDNAFDGWVVVEQDTCHGNPTEVARWNREFIERHVPSA
ncbi:MAG: sugar phosphate isomerase/epimerase [Chloroflexota bacterium]|nr:sugar phosphate isomerase/epimerase [Chloroflexota bacterium]